MRPEARLVLMLGLWMVICLIFVSTLEVFFVLMLLGILVLRELTDIGIVFLNGFNDLAKKEIAFPDLISILKRLLKLQNLLLSLLW